MMRLTATQATKFAAQAHAFAKSFAHDIQTLEKQIDSLLERIVEATKPTVITAYENKIAKLEREKLVLEEKRPARGNPRGRFEDMFELAMRILSNPSRLGFRVHAQRRPVLKLTFADRLSYCWKLGLRTSEMTLPFKAFGVFSGRRKRNGGGRGLLDKLARSMPHIAPARLRIPK
jgi:site-specific DNA recombinase